ncbi:MAG TPA: hypothetical protein VJI74_01185 [Candidatus Paceibacterota bacterium]
MKTLLKTFLFTAIFAFVFLAGSASANVDSELHITANGKFSAKNLVVIQKAGTRNFFCRATWGNTFVRVTVLAHDETKITKNHGEVATGTDIHEGDLLDVEGTLVVGGESLQLNATSIRDFSLEQEQKTLSGTVQSTDQANNSFVLPNKTFGNTVVLLASSTIQKGARTITAGDVIKGNKILSAAGIYDYKTNTLSASHIEVFQDKSVFLPRNFEGKLKTLSGTALPITLSVTVGGVDYTVYLAAGGTILNKNRGAANLSRFVLGDTVRFYGSMRQTNLTEIDATVLRDLNF